MILIDDRVGSKDLADHICRRPGHPEVEVTRLEYGDVLLPFSGPEDTTLLVGVEVKTLADVLACVQNGRFAGHQLIGLQANYDVSILLVEGKWRMEHNSGVLETLQGRAGWHPVSFGRRAWMYREFNRWLVVMSLVADVRIWTTNDRQETVQTVLDIYETGQTPWAGHKSLKQLDQSALDRLKEKRLENGRIVMRMEEPSRAERVAIQFDGLGPDKARAAAAHFKSPRALVNATEDEWQEVGYKAQGGKVRRIGKDLARQLAAQMDEGLGEEKC